VIDRKVFFDTVRGSLFKGGLSQPEVNGISAILDEWEKRGLSDPRWLAYMLATTFHETAGAMQPIREFGRGRGTKYGTTYYGRGFVQLTWETNYAKASKVVGVDLVKFPDRALMLPVAATILFDGMINGWFTGKKLADYISGATCDYEGARRIINGTDRKVLIAGYAMSFQKAIVVAAPQSPVEQPAVVTATVTPPSQKNEPTPAPVTAKDGFWANLIALFKALLS
jgi:putative chitinase